MPATRVLHVLGGLSQGGVENFLMNIYRDIDRNKIQFDFLVNRHGVFDDEVEKLGGHIYTTPSLQSIGPFKYRKYLNAFFEKNGNNYNIVHSHLNQVSGLILEIANKNSIPTRIAHAHNNSYCSNVVMNLYKELYLRPKIDKNANVLLACSADAATFMFKTKAKEAKIIKNGIPTKKFSFDKKKRNAFREQWGFKNTDFIVGHIGRFETQKNHDKLIGIFYEIQKIVSNSRLVLLGSGSLKERIRKKCDSLKIIDKVLFLDPTENTDSIYCGIDAFVFPSLFEGLGIALVEAQTSGLFCYASANTIPNEAKISDKMRFISLNSPDKLWARIIVDDYRSYHNTERTIIKNNPFDISFVTKDLIRIYNNKEREVQR